MTRDTAERARELIDKLCGQGKAQFYPGWIDIIVAHDTQIQTKARLEEAKYMKEAIQRAFDERKEDGPTEARVTLSWVLSRFRARIAALAQALQPEEKEGANGKS